MPKFKIPVSWQMIADIEVEEETLEKAIEKVETVDSEKDLPKGKYVQHSFVVDRDYIESNDEEDTIELEFLDGWNCHSIYKVNGALDGLVEVHFEDGVFNGVILFSEDDIDDEEKVWKPMSENDEYYEFIKEKSIKDYNGIK